MGKLTIITIFPLLVLLGCSPGMPDSVIPIVGKFESDYHKYTGRNIRVTTQIVIKSIPMEIARVGCKDKDFTIAECFYEDNLIVLRAESWEFYGDARKEALLYHELGHCMLGIEQHVNTLDSEGNPTSLMNLKLIEEEIYLDNQDYYLDNLFNDKNIKVRKTYANYQAQF